MREPLEYSFIKLTPWNVNNKAIRILKITVKLSLYKVLKVYDTDLKW